MKRIFLLFVLAACGGGSTTDDDAGNTNDSGNDVTSANDSSSPNDSSSSSDVVTTSDAGFGDGSIGPNQECDPNNNQCNPTLLCCSEPTHIPDASTHYVCEPPDKNNQCPKLP